MNAQAKPEFLLNGRGFQVPIDDVSPADFLKHELVVQMVERAKVIARANDTFKREVFTAAHDMIALLAQEYDVKIGGDKGNITLTSYDVKKRVMVGIDDQIEFGPELDVAKLLINEVINDQLGESSNFIKSLVRDAFEVDKHGKYNKARILALRKYRNADDSDKWQRAMVALDDAIIASGSKTYIRFYERNEFGKWIQIPLINSSL